MLEVHVLSEAAFLCFVEDHLEPQEPLTRARASASPFRRTNKHAAREPRIRNVTKKFLNGVFLLDLRFGARPREQRTLVALYAGFLRAVAPPRQNARPAAIAG